MTPRRFVIVSFPVLIGLLVASCAKEVPTKDGFYLRSGREWSVLEEGPLAPLQARSLSEKKLLEKIPRIEGADSPRLVIVGEQPQKLTGYKRKGDGWEAFGLAVGPEDGAKNAWAVSFQQAAPAGLILIRINDRQTGVAFVNGVDVRFHSALGRARKQAGELEGAKDILEEAVKGAPDDPALKNELALVYAAMKQSLGTARSLANEAIAQAKDDKEKARYFDTLGEIYFVEGDTDKGIESIERAIALDLQNPDFHKHLTKLIETVQEETPEAVLRKFYEHLGQGAHGDAADLASKFDVERLDDAGTLKSTLEHMARGGPFARVDIVSTIKHGKVARFKYALIGADGSRRNEDINLQYEDHRWTVSLP